MIVLLTVVHVLIALILILVVLVQSARGTDVAAAFGGMGSQAAFGPRGTATFLSKATVVLAALFMVTSLSLAILASRPQGGGGGSVLSGEPATTSQPAAPTPAPATAPGAPGLPSVRVETVPDTPPATAPANPQGGAGTTPAPQSSGQ